MQTIKIKFTKIEVPEFEKKGLLPVRFHYKVNGEDMSIEKSFGYVNHDPAAFAGDLIAEVRHVCKKQARPDPMDYSLLSGYVNAQVIEDKEGLTEERIANALKQIRDRIRTLKSMANANNYMNKYVDVKGLVIEL